MFVSQIKAIAEVITNPTLSPNSFFEVITNPTLSPKNMHREGLFYGFAANAQTAKPYIFGGGVEKGSPTPQI